MSKLREMVRRIISEETVPSGFVKMSSPFVDDKKVKWGESQVYFKHFSGNKIGILTGSQRRSGKDSAGFYQIKGFGSVEPSDIIAIKY